MQTLLGGTVIPIIVSDSGDEQESILTVLI